MKQCLELKENKPSQTRKKRKTYQGYIFFWAFVGVLMWFVHSEVWRFFETFLKTGGRRWEFSFHVASPWLPRRCLCLVVKYAACRFNLWGGRKIPGVDMTHKETMKNATPQPFFKGELPLGKMSKGIVFLVFVWPLPPLSSQKNAIKMATWLRSQGTWPRLLRTWTWQC